MAEQNMTKNNVNKKRKNDDNKKYQEIDYDKLAQAIAKAYANIEETKDLKMRKHSKMRMELMKFVNGAIYIMISVISIACAVFLWKNYTPKGIWEIISFIASSVIFVLIAIGGFVSQQESHNDDMHEAMAHFNSNMALIAIVLALITLLKTT